MEKESLVDLNAPTVERDSAGAACTSDETVESPSHIYLKYSPETSESVVAYFPTETIKKSRSERVKIGRSLQADILLNDAYMAREYAELWQSSASPFSFVIKNISSRKVIQVNEKALRQNEEACVKDKNTVVLDNICFTVSVKPGDFTASFYLVSIRASELVGNDLNKACNVANPLPLSHFPKAHEPCGPPNAVHSSVCENVFPVVQQSRYPWTNQHGGMNLPYTNQISGNMGPAGMNLPYTNQISGNMGPAGMNLPYTNQISGNMGPGGMNLPYTNQISGNMGPGGMNLPYAKQISGNMEPGGMSLPYANQSSGNMGPGGMNLSHNFNTPLSPEQFNIPPNHFKSMISANTLDSGHLWPTAGPQQSYILSGSHQHFGLKTPIESEDNSFDKKLNKY